MIIRKITRKDEESMPHFDSYGEARLWFKAKYGDAFQIDDSFVVGKDDNTTVLYRFNLILNPGAYEEGLRRLAQGTLTDADELLSSYQTVEILSDGKVHVIH